MLGTRLFRRRLLTFSVSTIGFYIISSFSDVLALPFTGPVVRLLNLTRERNTRWDLYELDC
jgi:hypothetical protein